MSKRFFTSILSGLIVGISGLSAQTSNLDGSWEGKLIINPQMGLRLVVNVAGSDGEEAVVTMDSPDQGAYGIPMQIEYISSDSLNVAVPQLMLKYKGKLEGDSIKGDFSQGPLNLPLNLKPKVTTLNRPQTPQPPFPYITEDVIFKSALDEADLYGTLTMPDNNTNQTPAVLLVSGSGTQNRDEEIFEHKPFSVIADYLAKNGVASLRYDDRGFDKSTGLSPNPTTYENSFDALGGIKFLKEKGFSKIGILGHSEGGLIADKVANMGNFIDFIVELGGPALPGDSILIFQNEFLLKDGGLPDEYVAMYIDAMRGMMKSQKENNPIVFDENEYEIFSPENLSNPVLAPLAKNLKDNFSDLAPWLRYFINYDPLSDLKQIEAPLMMIYGGKDIQVPADMNGDVVREEIPKALLKIYPDKNHLMQTCETGNIGEYDQIEETISPDVLSDIKEFILSIR